MNKHITPVDLTYKKLSSLQLFFLFPFFTKFYLFDKSNDHNLICKLQSIIV